MLDDHEVICAARNHLADALKTLLKPEIMGAPEFLLARNQTQQERTDIKEMRANHPDLVAEFTFPVEITRVVLSGITEDGEIVSARQLRNKEKAT